MYKFPRLPKIMRESFFSVSFAFLLHFPTGELYARLPDCPGPGCPAATDTADQIIKRNFLAETADHPNDPGAPRTVLGTTQRRYSEYLGHEAAIEDWRSMSFDTARTIFLTDHFFEPGFDALPVEIQPVMIFIATSSGSAKAIQTLQGTCTERNSDEEVGVKVVIPESLVECAKDLTAQDSDRLINSLIDEYIAGLRSRDTFRIFGEAWIRDIERFRPGLEGS